VILRLVAVALFDLPQAVILPGLDVVRIGLQEVCPRPSLQEVVRKRLAVVHGEDQDFGVGRAHADLTGDLDYAEQRE